MLTKLATIAAAATLISFSAFAQTSSGESTSSTTNAGDQALMQMDEATGNVFYSDMKARTLRPEAEWSKNWAGLNDEQRSKMKADCSTNGATNRSEGDTRVCDWAGNN
ncbi:hypothetical protein MUO32_23700 [Shinella sp. CPCC 101442]|uniref:hypothetical protein n=1 Tax=Shinella sp. CPCC 101442 TaxID=2932265 RepID=UPI002152C97A|nr:hypothetical protein [Shinella sp. CPCC 101442]MCR6502038.1 hypothetical protein [Shinella sp. CPCC 101442]